jgi:DtxR family Mn-dependent transcriptional regulator
MLGISWAEAHHEAGRWEHVISPVVEVALTRVLEDPTTCPHGNPIPGSNYELPTGACPLVELPVASSFTVERIPEELEFQPGQLDFLEGAGLIPGQAGEVLSVAPDGTTTVAMNGNPVGISSFAASRILVTSAPA